MNDDLTPNQIPQVAQTDEGVRPPTPPQMPPIEQNMLQGGVEPMPTTQQPNIDIQEQIAQARSILGLDALENEIRYKDNLAEAISKNPALTKEIIEKELSEIEKNDPDLAKQIKTSKVGMSMFVKGLSGNIAPDKEPDSITDDSDTSAQGGDEDEVLKRIKSGKASKIELGNYLNEISK